MTWEGPVSPAHALRGPRLRMGHRPERPLGHRLRTVGGLRREDGSFDVDGFCAVVDTVFLAQEIIVSPSSYPTEEIGANARAFRQLGLGYANLGALLMSNGMPYDSDEGRNVAAAITSLTLSASVMSSAITSQLPVLSRSAMLLTSRAVAITRCPAASAASAIARPKPLEHPVISHFF